MFSGISLRGTTLDSFLLVVVNKVVEKIIRRDGLTPIVSGLLSSEELQVVHELSDPTVKSITVQKRNDELSLIESESVVPLSEIHSTIKSTEHGEIRIKRKNGKSVQVTASRKKKL